MDYRIETASAFTVIGMEVKLTNWQSQNIAISKAFWPKFNNELKKAYLSQFGNWVKYAVTYKREEQLYYFCAIPKKDVIPDGLYEMEIKEQKYLVVEHTGDMDLIYHTYREIYKEILPQSGYEPQKEQFLHFEKYTEWFHWNRQDSVIEIWVPVQG